MTKKEKKEELAFWEGALKNFKVQEPNKIIFDDCKGGICDLARRLWGFGFLSSNLYFKIKEKSMQEAEKIARRTNRPFYLLLKTERIAFIKKQIRDLKK